MKPLLVSTFLLYSGLLALGIHYGFLVYLGWTLIGLFIFNVLIEMGKKL